MIKSYQTNTRSPANTNWKEVTLAQFWESVHAQRVLVNLLRNTTIARPFIVMCMERSVSGAIDFFLDEKDAESFTDGSYYWWMMYEQVSISEQRKMCIRDRYYGEWLHK